jgi:guanylate kinase
MERSHKLYYETHKKEILEKARLKKENETVEQRETRLEKRRQEYAEGRKKRVVIVEHNVKVSW